MHCLCSDAAFQWTHACATEFLDALVLATSRKRNARAGDRLPPAALERIFSFAIAAEGHFGRMKIRDTSRKFRCIVFVSQLLWSDVTTLPTNETSFMIARMRSWWTRTTLTLHLDNSNAPVNGLLRQHIPQIPLLMTSVGCIRSLIAEHMIANLGLLRTLHRQRFFPALEQLVLSSSEAETWGPLPLVFDDTFEDSVPAMDAPLLRTVNLRTVMVYLGQSFNITDLRLNSRTRGSRNRPRTWNKWPARMVYDLLVRNSALTVLHLVAAVRTETIDEFMPILTLPSLEFLVVCSQTAKEPTWVLDTVEFPDNAYVGFHIGHQAVKAFTMDDFYIALGKYGLNPRTLPR